MKRVSVCLIVKNEEAMLPGCLASVRALAHEIIVVDTGSTDRTVEVAKHARAKVASIAWEDDFSAARNASLAMATGDFVLVLDADERLAPGAERVIRKAVERADFDCGMLPMHEATRFDAPLADVVRGAERLGEPSYLPRLLRRTEDLRFEGIIHENVLPWLKARGMKLAFLEAPLVHLGAAREIRQKRQKGERNIALLEKALLASPDDPTPLGFLAHEHLEAGRKDLARDAVERGWALLEEASPGKLGSVLRLATARARIQLEDGDMASVLATVGRAELLDGAHPDLDFLRGSAHESIGLGALSHADRERELLAALAAYRAAIAKQNHRFAQAFVVGASSWAGATRAGCTLLALGRITEARAAFTVARSMRPRHVEAQLGLLECQIEDGDYHGALAALEPLLDDRPDAFVLGAAAAEALGLLDDFRLFLAHARERGGRGFHSPHRRERHAALLGALAAYLGAPMAVPGRAGAVFALLAREPLPIPEGAPFPLDRAQLGRLLTNLFRLGKIAGVAALLEPRAEQVIPGIGAVVRALLAELGLGVGDDGEPSYVLLGAFGPAELATLRDLCAAHPHLSVVDVEGGLGKVLDGGADGPALHAFLASRAPDRRRAVFVAEDAPIHFARAAELLPAARFVLVARDVRALAVGARADLLGDPGDAAERASRWNELVRRVREDAAAMPGRYLELRYEDLLADPKTTVRKLLAFLGEPEDARTLRYLVDAYPGRPDRWRRELGADARARVEAAAREALQTLGYEVTP